VALTRQFQPRQLLRSSRYQNAFGVPILLPNGTRAPGSFAPSAWHVGPGSSLRQLRAGVVQHFVASVVNVAFDASLPPPARGGLGVGQGSRTKFAKRVEMDPDRLSDVLKGRVMLDGIDLGQLLSVPQARFPRATLAAAAAEVQTVIAALWQPVRPPGTPATVNPVTWPVSSYEIGDRRVRRGSHDRTMTDFDGCTVSPPYGADDEAQWKYLAALIERPLFACLTHLWRSHGAVNGWSQIEAPEPDLTVVMVRKGIDPVPVGLLVDLEEHRITGLVTLRNDWAAVVGANSALIDGAFVADTIDRDGSGLPRQVLAARVMSSRSEGESATVSLGLARVQTVDFRVSLVDWVEPEDVIGL